MKKTMHESAARLFAEIEKLRPGESTTTGVAALLNVGPNLVTNWRERGVSVPGAVLAESNLGIPAVWILYGKHPPRNPWPFASINEAKVRVLDATQLAQLEAAILIAAGQVGLDVKM